MQAIVNQPSVTGVPGPPPAPRMTTLMKAAPSARGSKPETTPHGGGKLLPDSSARTPPAPSVPNARCRVGGFARDPTLPQRDLHPPIAASIGGHARPDTIEDSAERPGCRGSLR